jgi:hypothetical protein
MIYLYAFVTGKPEVTRRRGMFGETLRLVRAGAITAVVGEGASVVPPSAEPDRLAAHDAAVRRLAAGAAAILPARFGALFAGDDELADRTRPHEGALREALALVKGREQMTLRLFAAEGGVSREVDGPPASGTDYLHQRRAVRAVPELEPLRPSLHGIVRAERAERHTRPPLVASVYHLIDRGAARAYLAAVKRAAHRMPAVRVQATGPFPPYAFAPELG